MTYCTCGQACDVSKISSALLCHECLNQLPFHPVVCFPSVATGINMKPKLDVCAANNWCTLINDEPVCFEHTNKWWASVFGHTDDELVTAALPHFSTPQSLQLKPMSLSKWEQDSGSAFDSDFKLSSREMQKYMIMPSIKHSSYKGDWKRPWIVLKLYILFWSSLNAFLFSICSNCAFLPGAPSKRFMMV